MRNCGTVRKGFRCQFAARNGSCTYNNETCSPIVSACEGCTNIITFENNTYCTSYMSPYTKWIGGAYCPLCTIKKVIDVTEKNKINPLKASKRAAKARKATQGSPNTTPKKKK